MAQEAAELWRLRMDASDDEAFALAKAWASLLASEDYTGALAVVEHGPPMSPDFLRHIVETYGGFGRKGVRYRVTSVDTATFDANDPRPPNPDRIRRETYRADDDDGLVSMDFSLPVNGHWGDLTAKFTFVPDGDEFVLYLNDVLIP